MQLEMFELLCFLRYFLILQLFLSCFYSFHVKTTRSFVFFHLFQFEVYTFLSITQKLKENKEQNQCHFQASNQYILDQYFASTNYNDLEQYPLDCFYLLPLIGLS